jgi:YVTN family beta-propeller protein
MALSFARTPKTALDTSSELRNQPLEPYVGPQPFKREIEDQKKFFGRDHESDELVALITSHNLVLVYAQSGAGKTSIFNAKVIPILEKFGFDVLPVARVRIASTPSPDLENQQGYNNPLNMVNLYIFNAIQNLNDKIAPGKVVNTSLSEFLYHYFPNRIDENGEVIPQVLIFDQLEEIFNPPYPTEWKRQQEDFFKQIAEAVDDNSLLRIVFIIREDYLAQLDPFLYLLPENLRPRFRLERFREKAALEAIKGPIKNIGNAINVDLKQVDEDVKKIVNDLMKIRVEDPAGNIRSVEGEFIEPIQLQVVCQRWWEELLKGGSNKNNDLVNVDNALQDYYVDAIREATKKTGIHEESIRKWCEKKLITPNGTRSIVHQDPYFTEGMSNEVIDVLASKYLVRREWRSGAAWYELTHDRLIGPIKSSNQFWLEEQNRKKKSRNIKVTIPSAIIGVIAVVLIAYFYTHQPIILPPSEAVPVEQLPSFLSVNPETNLVYVANYLSDTVSVLDGRTSDVRSTIDVGSRPYNTAVNPATNRVYVTNSDSNTVSVIDGKTNEVLNVSVGESPRGLDINPITNTIYVANSLSKTISVIDGNTSRVVQNHAVGNTPVDVAINPETNLVYVANADDNTVSVVDGKASSNSTAASSLIPVQKGPVDIAINPNNNTIYVANADSDSVSVIDIDGNTAKVVESLRVGDSPRSISINPETNLVYVANADDNTVSVVDGNGNGIIQTLAAGNSPRGVSINPKTNILYTANANDYTVTVMNLTSYIPISIQVGETPYDVAVDSETNRVYVTNADSDTVSVIDGKANRVVKNLPVGKVPIGVAINPKTGMVYVANSVSNTISAIDGKASSNSMVASSSLIPVQKGPVDIAINPNNNTIYVANVDNDTVSVIDGKTNEVLDNIDVDQAPVDIAINPNNNTIYVANSLSKTISVIDGKTNRVVQTLAAGNSPSAIDINIHTETMYIANSRDSSLRIIQ